jgi:hypothetical protein
MASTSSTSVSAQIPPTSTSAADKRFPCDFDGCRARFYSIQAQAYHAKAHARGSLKLCARCGASWGLRRLCEECISVLVSSGASVCKDCLKELPLNRFPVEKKALFGRHSRCRECYKVFGVHSRAKLERFLLLLYKRCVESCKSRSEKGRKEAATMTLTKAAFRKMWDIQGGKCYYSGMPMAIGSHVDFKCSPERLNPAIGYIEGNVVFCCYEFNGPRQWTLEKIRQIKTLVHSQIPNDFQAVVAAAMKRLPQQNSDRPARTKVEDGRTLVECTDCFVFKPRDQMQYSKCKDCVNAKMRVRRCTLRGRLQHMLGNAQSCSRARSLKKNSCRSDNTCSITLDDLFTLLKAQNGRCAYSNIPLTYAGGDWTASLERLDCGRGYHVGNVALIAVEFNTADRSCQGPERKTGGSGAWSVAKFQQFLRALETNDNHDLAQSHDGKST